MAYIEDLINQSNMQAGQQQFQSAYSLGLPEGMAYSSLYPEWEVTTPQYLTPNPWSLAQMGYRTNELVFTCIQVRSDSVAEAPLYVFDDTKDEREEIKHHKIRNLLRNPLPNVSEQFFWKVVETYLCIAGFSAWEKQRNNRGEVVGLWPMRPDWCSFMRGQQKPIRAIRYQPHGLPPLDISIEDILLFAYFDPLYPLLKPFSPTMSALNMIDVDNNMTKMLNTFIKNGAFLGGVLSTENQVLQEAEAKVYKDRWRDVHGGADKAGDIAVLGKGLKFQTTNSSFRDMVFPEVDARSEARITMTFRVPPMLIGAKIGIDRSTFTNYPEARKGFYEGPISSEWNFLASVLDDQLVPDFEAVKDNFVCAFYTRDIKALKEDRTSQVDRADKMYRGKWAKLNEARKEAGLDPMPGEEGNAFYQEPELPLIENQNGNEEVVEANDITDRLLPKPKSQEELDLEETEEKKFRTYAKRRIKEKREADIPEYEFKYLSEKRQRQLLSEFNVPDPDAAMVLSALRETVKSMQPKDIPQPINIYAQIEAGKPAEVYIENKSVKQSPPVVNIEVNPTPIENITNIEVKPADVNLPKLKKSTDKVKRDGNDNIEGKITEYEYEE
jgi:HK97 family phage portal protein